VAAGVRAENPRPALYGASQKQLQQEK
jgi:hypothetical protein